MSEAAQAPPSQPKPAQVAEDDEFEDFPHEDWKDSEADLGVNKESLWEDNWDDDDLDDDFSKQLKAELAKTNGEQDTQMK